MLIYKCTIISKGAEFLEIKFSNFVIPKYSLLKAYSKLGDVQIFNSANTKKPGQYYTLIFPNDSVTIEFPNLKTLIMSDFSCSESLHGEYCYYYHKTQLPFSMDFGRSRMMYMNIKKIIIGLDFLCTNFRFGDLQNLEVFGLMINCERYQRNFNIDTFKRFAKTRTLPAVFQFYVKNLHHGYMV